MAQSEDSLLSILDYQDILTLISVAARTANVFTFRQLTADGLQVLFDALSVSWTELETEAADNPISARSYGMLTNTDYDHAELLSRFLKYSHTHPCVDHFKATGEKEATAISDLIGRDAFRALPIYKDFYSHFGVEDQLVIIRRHSPRLLLGIAVNSVQWGFDHKDHRTLSVLGGILLNFYKGLYRTLDRTDQETWDPVQIINNTSLLKDAVVPGLTARENEVLFYIAQGKRGKTIADLCDISEGTVRKHTENIFKRLGVNNRVEATLVALEALQRAR